MTPTPDHHLDELDKERGIGGDGVELVLDDNMVMPTFGSKRMSSPTYVIQALDICARIAAVGRG